MHELEPRLTEEEVDYIASKILPKQILIGIVEANWEARLAAVEQLKEHIQQMNPTQVFTQVIVRVLKKPPGFRDTNLHILALRLDLIRMLAENYPFSSIPSDYCLKEVIAKLEDDDFHVISAEVLSAIAGAAGLDLVANEMMTYAFEQEILKVQLRTLFWLCTALTGGFTFDFKINAQSFISNLKKAMCSEDPGVKAASLALLGSVHIYIGDSLFDFFDDENSALTCMVRQECGKIGISNSNEKAGLQCSEGEEVPHNAKKMKLVAEKLKKFRFLEKKATEEDKNKEDVQEKNKNGQYGNIVGISGSNEKAGLQCSEGKEVPHNATKMKLVAEKLKKFRFLEKEATEEDKNKEDVQEKNENDTIASTRPKRSCSSIFRR